MQLSDDSMTTRIFLLCSLGVLNTVAATSGVNTWRGFGGPNSDFSVERIELSFNQPPTVLWSQELGFGNSSIVVFEDELFTTFRKVDANGATSADETVVSLDTNTGRILWELSYTERPIEGQNDYGGGTGPHATPFVTERHVFTLGYAGTLHCLDRKTGDVIWKKQLVNDFGAEVIQFGFSASPVVLDDKLVIQTSGEQAGLMALDPFTGEVIWKSPPTGASYATPVLMEIAGEQHLVFHSRDTVQGVRLQDGLVRWEFKLPKEGLTNVPTPLLVGEGRVFIAGQGVGGAMVILVVEDGGGFKVDELWRNTRVNFFHNSFIQQGKFVFGGSSFLYAIDLKDGETAWTERGYELANVIGIGAKALLAPKDGRIVLAALDDDGVDELHAIEVFETEAWAPPTIVGDRVYARDREALVALSLSGAKNDSNVPGFLAAKKELVRLAEEGDESALAEQLQRWSEMKRRPLSLSAQFRTAQQLADAENTSAAKALLKALIGIDPDSVLPYAKLGRLLLVEGEREAALESYRAAIEVEPEFEEGRRILSQLDGNAQNTGNVQFKISRLRGAKLVTLAGSFNNWDPFHTFLRKNGSTWETSIELPPGEYEYKLVMDGNWMLDPGNPKRKSDGNNNVNSLLIVE